MQCRLPWKHYKELDWRISSQVGADQNMQTISFCNPPPSSVIMTLICFCLLLPPKTVQNVRHHWPFSSLFDGIKNIFCWSVFILWYCCTWSTVLIVLEYWFQIDFHTNICQNCNYACIDPDICIYKYKQLRRAPLESEHYSVEKKKSGGILILRDFKLQSPNSSGISY